MLKMIKNRSKTIYPNLVFKTPDIFRNICSRVGQDEYDAVYSFYDECKKHGLHRINKGGMSLFYRIVWSYVINEVGVEPIVEHALKEANKWYNADVIVTKRGEN